MGSFPTIGTDVGKGPAIGRLMQNNDGNGRLPRSSPPCTSSREIRKPGEEEDRRELSTVASLKEKMAKGKS